MLEDTGRISENRGGESYWQQTSLGWIPVQGGHFINILYSEFPAEGALLVTETGTTRQHQESVLDLDKLIRQTLGHTASFVSCEELIGDLQVNISTPRPELEIKPNKLY